MAEEGTSNQGDTGGAGDNGNGEGAVNFMDSLSDDLKSSEHLKGIDDVNKLAQGYVDVVSSRPVVPESVDDYTMDWPSDIPKDEKGYDGFRNLAHELKLPVDVWKQIVEFDVARSGEALKELEAEEAKLLADAVNTLKSDWGDKYDANMVRAKKVLDMSESKLAETELGNAPELAKLLVWVADKVLEDTSAHQDGGPGGPKTRVGEDGKPILHFPSME